MADSLNVRRSAAWSTFGPHAIGTERFGAVSSGTSFAQVAGAILGNRSGCRTLIRMRSPRLRPWQDADCYPSAAVVPMSPVSTWRRRSVISSSSCGPAATVAADSKV